MLPLAAFGPLSAGWSSCDTKDLASVMRAELAARKMSELLRASANTVVLKVASVWPAAGAAPLAAPESSKRCKIGTKSVAKAFLEFEEDGRMKPSAYFDRVVDVMEELVKFTLLTRDVAPYLVDRYSERKESAEALSKRVNQKSL